MMLKKVYETQNSQLRLFDQPQPKAPLENVAVLSEIRQQQLSEQRYSSATKVLDRYGFKGLK
jgi:hypothetical protein